MFGLLILAAQAFARVLAVVRHHFHVVSVLIKSIIPLCG